MRHFLKAIVMAVTMAGLPNQAKAACDTLLTQPAAKSAAKRAVTARDLIELRDIGDGEASNFGQHPRLALSPDRRRIAFSLVRADLATNGHCLGMFVMDLAPGARPHALDQGGELIPALTVLRGYSVPTGEHKAIIPVWSPDGRALAYLRRDGGLTQLWVAPVDHGTARAVTHSTSDISAFQWSADGQHLLYATQPGIPAAQAAVAIEGKSGWHYDARVQPQIGARPLIAGDLPRAIFTVTLADGSVHPASASQAATFPAAADNGLAIAAPAIGKDGWRAIAERQGTSLLAPLALTVIDPAGRKQPCHADWCSGGITGMWWSSDSAALYVLRREGPNKAFMVLYRVVPGHAPTKIFTSADDIQDCAIAQIGLVCTRENATTPRRVAVFDLVHGHARDLFDPNPDFANIALGTVRRLFARNTLGLDSWADLVLPPHYTPGTRLPLVIVQYHSDGFLRGGTGDEYPIHLFAARGFAVLSFEIPPRVATAYPNAKSAFELNAITFKDWGERRSLLSSLLAEIDAAIATGTVDPTRIGISGLSDGASTVEFAMINSHRFAAAAVSSCCYEPRSMLVNSGPAFSEYLRKMGFPGVTRDDPDFWRPNSFVVSGATTDTPLLMQLADSEYIGALETYQALTEYKKPVDVFVFPDEFHVKRQPEHRAAIYARNLDWFAFWLQDTVDPDPSKAAQYARWQAMRQARGAAGTRQDQ